MNHTPGDWQALIPRHPKHRESRWIFNGSIYIAKVYGGSDRGPDTTEETDANALLIAKVPTMYKALQHIASLNQYSSDIARAAISEVENSCLT